MNVLARKLARFCYKNNVPYVIGRDNEIYNGHAITISRNINNSSRPQHEIAHWLLAPNSRRHDQYFGLGQGDDCNDIGVVNEKNGGVFTCQCPLHSEEWAAQYLEGLINITLGCCFTYKEIEVLACSVNYSTAAINRAADYVSERFKLTNYSRQVEIFSSLFNQIVMDSQQINYHPRYYDER